MIKAILEDKFVEPQVSNDLLGAEPHSGAMENGELWHILAVGLPPVLPGLTRLTFTPRLIRKAVLHWLHVLCASAALVAVAHPEWSGLTTADARSIEAAHAVEVYNHGCPTGCDRPHGFYTLDQLLTDGRKLTLCATDDAHFLNRTILADESWLNPKRIQPRHY